jgi:hypothetical protein
MASSMPSSRSSSELIPTGWIGDLDRVGLLPSRFVPVPARVQKYDAKVKVVMRRRIPTDTPIPYPKPPIRPVEKIPAPVSEE